MVFLVLSLKTNFLLKNLAVFSLAFLLIVFGNTVGAEPQKINQAVELALKATPNLENGKKLYFNCAICHTPEGWGTPNGMFPQVSGQHQSVILKQLADINKGNRDNPTMSPFSYRVFDKGPQALADLSAYIEKLFMVPNNSVGPGLQLSKGKELYNENCKKCHGDNGEGDAKEFYPRIQGQHYQYLLRQLRWIKSGKRRNSDEKMVKQIQGFSHNDLILIADYVSRLRPDKSLLADHLDWRNPDFRSKFMTAPKMQSNQIKSQ